MAVTSYRTYNYLTYLLLYCGAIAWLGATRRREMSAIVGDRPWLAIFLAVYGIVYLLAIAFYYPTSGTGTARFLLAHVTPLFFAASRALVSERLRSVEWRLGTHRIGLGHFHVAVASVLILDIAFHVWPRLMTTYGGF